MTYIMVNLKWHEQTVHGLLVYPILIAAPDLIHDNLKFIGEIVEITNRHSWYHTITSLTASPTLDVENPNLPKKSN